jgi:hypothetical protein
MHFRKLIHGGAAIGMVVVSVGPVANAAPLTPGNLLVTRAVGGSGTYDVNTGQMSTPTALTGSGTAATVVLDEYTTTGTFVQSIVMPNVNVAIGQPAGNRALTFSGTQNNEGAITLSQNGQYFVFAGYNQTAGVAGTNAAQSTAIERVVGLVDLNGNFNTTTALQDVANAQSVRSAYSTDGNDIWIGGSSGSNVTVNTVTTVSGGVHHTTLGNSISTQLTAGNTNQRILNGFNGQLYLSYNATTQTTRGVNAVGTGFPAPPTFGPSALATFTQLPGFSATTTPTPASETADDYWFKDANTLYIADQRTDGVNGGVQKWLFSDTNADLSPDTWVFQYNVTLGTQVGPTTGGNVGGHGLAGTIDELTGNAILFATTFDGAGLNTTKLIKLVDDGTQAGFASSLTVLANSPNNTTFATAFRGVEVIPVPEPATAAVLGGLGMLLLRTRRRES